MLLMIGRLIALFVAGGGLWLSGLRIVLRVGGTPHR